MSDVAARDARLSPDLVVRRIIQVNHAGENGAISIYRQQIIEARRRYPELLPWLEETLGHEQTHRDRFLKLMPERGARPCPAMAGCQIIRGILAWLSKCGNCLPKP